jgi:RNA polymerase sigma factor (TIGR02999 family)
MREVTEILDAIQAGDTRAANELLPLVYDALRGLAAKHLAGEAPGQTLQPTALVHEVYIKLLGANCARAWNDRGHFFAAAAVAMRRILVDNARRKHRIKNGGARQRESLSEHDIAAPLPVENILDLDEALTRFSAAQPVMAELVNLRFFAGLSENEAAAALGLSRATASRYWTYARAWLIKAMNEQNS